MEKDNTNNVVNLNEFHERKRKTSRLTDEEHDLVARIVNDHPSNQNNQKGAETEYMERPDLVARHIQDQIETNGYSAEIVDSVLDALDDLAQDNPDLTPSELSSQLAEQYVEFVMISYEENERRSNEAAKANYERMRKEKEKLTRLPAGKASLRLVHSTNDTPPNTASQSRAHLYSVDDSEQ